MSIVRLRPWTLLLVELAAILASCAVIVWRWEPWVCDSRTLTSDDWDALVTRGNPSPRNSQGDLTSPDGTRRMRIREGVGSVIEDLGEDHEVLFSFETSFAPRTGISLNGFADNDTCAFGTWHYTDATEKESVFDDPVFVFRRRHPEWWWGHFYRPEVWVAFLALAYFTRRLFIPRERRAGMSMQARPRLQFSLMALVETVMFLSASAVVWFQWRAWAPDAKIYSRAEFEAMIPERVRNDSNIFTTPDGTRKYVTTGWHELRHRIVETAPTERVLFEFKRREILSEPCGFFDDNRLAFIEGPWDEEQSSKCKGMLWRRRHPEWWWGHFLRPEVWAALLFGLLLFRRIYRWRKTF